MTRVHPLAAILAGFLEGLERDLDRQDHRLVDLPPLRTYSRGAMVQDDTVMELDQAEDGEDAA